MKIKRTNVFNIVSSLALVILLGIQVQWILKTARIKEELFNEKANMVLSKTAEALCSDEQTCRNMGRCMMMEGMMEQCRLELGKSEVFKIDSLLKHYMDVYSFHFPYSFEVVRPGEMHAVKTKGKSSGNIFKKRLEDVAIQSGLELNLIFPDKHQFIIEEMGVMFISSVLLIFVVCFFFMITIRALRREKKIFEHTSDFLNNMTHEFKTPLTNISLAGKMMTRETNLKSPEKIKHYSGIILDENEKLQHQVEQVLSMVALERGEIPVARKETDMNELVMDSMKCMSVQVESRGGSIQLDLGAERTLVDGDKAHLGNALCSLIDNAIKYSADKPEISVSTANDGNFILLSVADKGIGIDKKFRKDVFSKFYRVPTGDVHNVKGFGLGLAYVKRIAELHGGTVELESEPGKGSVFTMRLPVKNNA